GRERPARAAGRERRDRRRGARQRRARRVRAVRRRRPRLHQAREPHRGLGGLREVPGCAPEDSGLRESCAPSRGAGMFVIPLPTNYDGGIAGTAGTRYMNHLAELDTPAALVDARRMQANIARMQSRMDGLGAKLRRHVKTSKSVPVVHAQLEAGARGITVSTLKEAEEFFDAGIDDILYAVGITPDKLPRALALRRRGCDLKLVTDNVAGAEAVSRFGRERGEAFEAWIEIDVDGHRSGIPPEGAALVEVGRALHDGGARLGGVMAHAGGSYALDTPAALQAAAEQERAGTVRAAERLRQAGLPCPVVSVGSTPTALSARALDGVTEVRAGVYVFFDLVMHNIGVCAMDEIALSVLATVIGHQQDKGWAIVDAGWMAMSRDRGTQAQK